MSFEVKTLKKLLTVELHFALSLSSVLSDMLIHLLKTGIRDGDVAQ